MLIILLYSIIYPFSEVAAKMMQDKFSIDEQTANILFGLPAFIAAGFSPFVGIIADRYNIRIYTGNLFDRFNL